MNHVANIALLFICACLIVYGRPHAKKGQLRHLLAFVGGATLAALVILHALKGAS